MTLVSAKRLVRSATVVLLFGASSSTAGVTHVPNPIIKYCRDPGTIMVLRDSDSNPRVEYTTSQSMQISYLAAAVTTSGATWHRDDAGDDWLTVDYAVTGSGTLPSVGSITSLVFNNSVCAINGVQRTFGSSDAASELARALAGAKELPTGATLSESGGVITLTIDLEETWVTVTDE